jgi:hypothetical protein
MRIKKGVCILIISVMIIAFFPSLVVNAENNINYDIFTISNEDGSVPNSNIKGDLNFDGLVTRRDLRLLSRHISRIELLSGEVLNNADINSDGNVNSQDVRDFAKILSGEEPSSINAIQSNQAIQLKTYLNNVLNTSDINWESNDTDVVTVNSSGILTIESSGQAKVTAKVTYESTEYTDERR